jgi:hypothetical protein
MSDINMAVGSLGFTREGFGLVGDVRGPADTPSAEIDKFLQSLKNLMEEYGIDKLDIGWSMQHVRQLKKV